MLTVRLDHLNVRPEHRILDLGCGEGRHAISLHLLTQAKHVVAVDLNIADIKTARQRLNEFPKPSPEQHCNIFVADGLKLPFAANTFDIVICSEVLEHIPMYAKMLREIERVTKTGGVVAISVPRTWPEKICWWLSSAYHQNDGGHIRIFNANKLKNDIEQLSLQYSNRHWAHALHVPYWWLRCFYWNKGQAFFLARWYHRILVWDLMRKPWLTQTLDKWLNPLMGKSVVMYFTKVTK